MVLYAVIRVRGLINIKPDIKKTLQLLRLTRANHSVLISKTPVTQGMLQRVKDYVTWGEIDNKTLEKMIEKRGRLAGDKKLDSENAKGISGVIGNEGTAKNTDMKPVFRLSPPSRGYKSTRKLYPKGALGYRGEKINELLNRMI